MSRRPPPPPLQLTKRKLRDEEIYVAHHVVTTDDLEDPDLVRSFMSRSALGLPPRTWTQEGSNPELADGISAYRTFEAAAATARQALDRQRSFGEYVAELHLVGNRGIEIAEWGQRGHLTIWGDPLILRGATVDIVHIGH